MVCFAFHAVIYSLIVGSSNCRRLHLKCEHLGLKSQSSRRGLLLQTLADLVSGDNKKPQCSNCQKTGRECQQSQFPFIFRHEHNPSIRPTKDRGPSKTETHTGFPTNHRWVEQPSSGTPRLRLHPERGIAELTEIGSTDIHRRR